MERGQGQGHSQERHGADASTLRTSQPPGPRAACARPPSPLRLVFTKAVFHPQVASATSRNRNPARKRSSPGFLSPGQAGGPQSWEPVAVPRGPRGHCSPGAPSLVGGREETDTSLNVTLGPGGRRQTHSVSVSAPTTSQRDVGSEPVQAESRPERPGAGRRKQASHTGRPAEEAGAPVSHGSRDRTRRPEATGVSGRELLLGGPGEAQVEASGLVPPPGSWHTFFVCDKDVPPTGTHSAGSQPRGRDAQELVQGTGTSKGPTVALAGAGSGPPLTSAPRSRLPSSRPVTVLGPFFFLSLARMDDSRSGNGGISSRTVAWEGRSPGERGSKPRGARAAAGRAGRGGPPGCRCWRRSSAAGTPRPAAAAPRPRSSAGCRCAARPGWWASPPGRGSRT